MRPYCVAVGTADLALLNFIKKCVEAATADIVELRSDLYEISNIIEKAIPH